MLGMKERSLRGAVGGREEGGCLLAPSGMLCGPGEMSSHLGSKRRVKSLWTPMFLFQAEKTEVQDGRGLAREGASVNGIARLSRPSSWIFSDSFILRD